MHEAAYAVAKIGDLMVLIGCTGISLVLVPFALSAPTPHKQLVRATFAWFILLIAAYHAVAFSMIWLDLLWPLAIIKLLVGTSSCLASALYWARYRA